jgi:hypothetical protein
MDSSARARAVRAAVQHDGRTFCEQAGFTLRDTPSALWQLVVLASLLAKPIDSQLATAAAAELRRAGGRTPTGLLGLTWQQRVDALGRAHYRRFDESMATRTGELAQSVLDRYRGDLRRLADDADDDPAATTTLLTQLPGLGPSAAAIVLREAQAIWTWAQPYFDERVLDGARAVGLPATAAKLAHVADVAPVRLAALLVRATLDDHLATRLRSQFRAA